MKKIKILTVSASILLAAIAGKSQAVPVIAGQFPVTYTNALSLFAGASPAFSVVATNTAPIYFQWLLNGSAIAGATNAGYTITNAQSINTGTYACIVSNLSGSVTSTNWNVSIIPAPAAPYPQAVLAANPVGYWRLNEGPDDGNGNQGALCFDSVGGNNGIYTNITLAQTPGYNQASDPTETAAEFGETGISLINSDANSIQGINFASPTNTSAAFSIEAWVNGYAQTISGAGVIAKGWGGGGEQVVLDVYKSGVSRYRFFVRTATGSAVTVLAATNLSVPFAPNGQNGGLGTWQHVVGVCDEANGALLIYVNGVLSGKSTIAAGSGILPSTNALVIGSRMSNGTTNNNYQFYGLINEVAAYKYALSSNVITAHYLAAGIAPVITLQPVGTNINVNNTLTLTAGAAGTLPLSYFWFDQNANSYISGQTNATLVISNIAAGDSYYLTASNAYGSINSSAVTVNVLSGAPQIIADVQKSLFTVVGGAISNSAVIGGTAPFYYQWQANGTNLTDNNRISGSQNSVLTIANVQTTDAGTYQLLITNAFGSIASSVATLAVGTTPVTFNGTGAGWVSTQVGTYNVPVFTNNVLTLTDTNLNQGRSFFMQIPQYIGAFSSTFTYQDVDTNGANGFAFVLQNDPRGAAALGGPGGNLGIKAGSGYAALTPSAALEFNIYTDATYPSAGTTTSQYGLLTGGTIGPALTTGNVSLNGGDPIQMTVNYAQGMMSLTMTDVVAQTSFATNFAINLTQAVGNTNTAYVGFTGTTGGFATTQTITNFSFVSIPTESIQSAGTNLMISWPGSIVGYQLQQNSNLAGTNWVNVTTNLNTPVNGQFQVPAPMNGSNTFYRLILQ